MIKLRIRTVKSRSYQCDIAGCRNRTKFLITKRDDIASHPVHLCASCIVGIKALYDEMIAAEVAAAAPAVQETAPIVEESAPESAETAAEDAPNKEEDAPEPVIADYADSAVLAPAKKPAARSRRKKE